MAEQFITYTAHGVVENSTLLATHGGRHIVNGVCATANIDNGSVCKLGTYAGDDYFNIAVPTVTDAVLLVTTEPKIYSEYTKKMQEESNFYNGKGEIMQLDDMDRYDRIALSDEAFASAAVPAIGQYVGVDGVGYKLTTLGATKPTGRGFIGYIYGKANNGNWKIIVYRNLDVDNFDDKYAPKVNA